MVRILICLLLTFSNGIFADSAITKPAKKKLTSQEKRKHKRCSPPQKTYREYNFDEFDEVKKTLLKNGDREGAIRVAERMVPLAKKLIDLEKISLDLADLYFEAGQYEKAAQKYTEFTKLYPGNANIEHALYYAIECNFKNILDAEHDQTITKETVELTKQFLDRAKIFVEFTDKVLDIQKQCYNRLIESEQSIIAFYMDRGNYKSVQKRLDNLKKDYLDFMPKIEANILMFDIKLAEKQNNPGLLLAKRTELAEKFPNFNEVVQIAEAKAATSFVNKF